MTRIKSGDAVTCAPDPTMKARRLAELGKRWLTPQMALMHAGCMSLAQRISEWRADGYEFHQRVVQVGPRTRVASYKLARKPVRG